jgi:hypothetical protein
VATGDGTFYLPWHPYPPEYKNALVDIDIKVADITTGNVNIVIETSMDQAVVLQTLAFGPFANPMRHLQAMSGLLRWVRLKVHAAVEAEVILSMWIIPKHA